jgi:hypothetical protein
MSSRFFEFLGNEKIDPRRLIAASRQIERLRPEDRQIRLKKRLSRSADATPAPAPADGEKAEVAKRRSGRTITPRLLQVVEAGGPVSGPQKTRLLRALNRVLEQKKKEPIDLRKVF